MGNVISPPPSLLSKQHLLRGHRTMEQWDCWQSHSCSSERHAALLPTEGLEPGMGLDDPRSCRSVK